MSLTIILSHTNVLSLSQVTYLCCACGQMRTQNLVNAINSLVLSFFWPSSHPVSRTISLKPKMYRSLWSGGLHNGVGRFILYMAGPLVSAALVFTWERNFEKIKMFVSSLYDHMFVSSLLWPPLSMQVKGRDGHSSPVQEWKPLKLVYTVNPLRKNLQDVNFQRCQWTGMSEVAACLRVSYCWWFFSSTISHLLTLPSQYFFLSVHLMPVPLCQLLYCTAELFKVNIKKNIYFVFGFYILSVWKVW